MMKDLHEMGFEDLGGFVEKRTGIKTLERKTSREAWNEWRVAVTLAICLRRCKSEGDAIAKVREEISDDQVQTLERLLAG